MSGLAPHSTSPSWDPGRYAQFSGERTRPALDLLQRLPQDPAPRRVFDLGCGTGEITAALKERWPEAEVTGLDSAATMLAKARQLTAAVTWVEGDIAAWRPEQPVDLVFSNAALQWLGRHEAVFSQLMGSVAPGGRLAVQMPRNYEAPSHRLMRETAAQGPWRERLEGVLRAEPVLAPERYYDFLAPLASEVEIWETEYLHVLDGETPVLDWVSGTGLRPVLDALADPAERDAFARSYQARLAEAYPPHPDGRTLFPFRRLFLIARRG